MLPSHTPVQRRVGASPMDLEGGSGAFQGGGVSAYAHASWNPVPVMGVLGCVVAFSLFLFPSIRHVTLVLGVACYGLLFAFWLAR